ncbi:hypothetical protein Xish_01996 [Xenorhabdus ishibashii]|uniref:Uncharacterized protein n=1 Tax=Xenorhabdus ishibashii TaxID=1034471 RepID=A0A2D0KHB1_9GAMM|nr:hypothetical protein Xish_01996 [Xenorhabdus ishibashii]
MQLKQILYSNRMKNSQHVPGLYFMVFFIFKKIILLIFIGF